MGAKSVLILIVLSALIGTAAAAALRGPVVIEGDEAREDLARALGRDAEAFKDHRVELISGNGIAIVLLDGTEAGRLGKERAAAWMETHPEFRRALEAGHGADGDVGSAAGTSGPGGGSASWLSIFLARGDWLRLGRWEEKLAVEYRLDYLFSDVLVRRNRVGVSAFKRFKGLYLGGDWAHTAFKGDLADSVPRAAEAGAIAYGFEAGLDFLRYRLGRAPLALPEYVWAEKDLEGKWFARGTPAAGTSVVRLFEARPEPGWEHRVEAKVGALHYALTVAPDAYKAPLHQASLEDLPGVLGTWGMGILLTPDGFIPGGWYRFRPITLHRLGLFGAERPVEIQPGRITYFRSTRDQFRLAFAGELRLGL